MAYNLSYLEIGYNNFLKCDWFEFYVPMKADELRGKGVDQLMSMHSDHADNI